ncbi:MAG: mevalonate kinase [Phycisphaerae bacterium]
MPRGDDTVELFVPGRLCIFGEHSDWAAQYGIHNGYCLVIGTDQGLSAEAKPSDEFVVQTRLPDELGRPTGRVRTMRCPTEPNELLAAARDPQEFFRYCAGVAYQMRQEADVHDGLEVRITSMDLPLRKGVSSSAAVCILLAKAFDKVYDLRLFPHELMEIAYHGERLTGSQCGRMDQACIYGKTPVLLTFDSQTDVRVEPIFPAGEVSMFFVDLAGKKDTVRILSDLQSAYHESQQLRSALGAENERIVRAAYRAIGAGDAAAVGGLMTEAQRVFDELVAPHSPDELASPLLHEVLNLPDIQEHIHGGKGVGSQGDGTAQFVAASPEDRDEAMRKITRAYPQMRCFPLTITAQWPGAQ